MHTEGKYIIIDNSPANGYDCLIQGIGSPDDEPCQTYSMWSWINHLRVKNWWSKSLENEFIKCANTILTNVK